MNGENDRETDGYSAADYIEWVLSLFLFGHLTDRWVKGDCRNPKQQPISAGILRTRRFKYYIPYIGVHHGFDILERNQSSRGRKAHHSKCPLKRRTMEKLIEAHRKWGFDAENLKEGHDSMQTLWRKRWRKFGRVCNECELNLDFPRLLRYIDTRSTIDLTHA